MNKILDAIASVNGEINSVVWGMFGLVLLIGTGIIVTVLTKFFQVSHIGLWFKHTLGSLFKKDVIKHSKEKGRKKGEVVRGRAGRRRTRKLWL